MTENKMDLDHFAASLSKAQGELPILQKRKQGYGYKYADMAEIVETISPVLTKYGFGIVGSIEIIDGNHYFVATLKHISNQSHSCRVPLFFKPDAKVNAMQAYGSALTYAKRYAIITLLNLAADEESDDDGVKSAPKGVLTTLPKAPMQEEEETFLSSEELKQLSWRVDKLPGSLTEILDNYNVSSLDKIPSRFYNEILSELKKKWYESQKK